MQLKTEKNIKLSIIIIVVLVVLFDVIIIK